MWECNFSTHGLSYLTTKIAVEAAAPYFVAHNARSISLQDKRLLQLMPSCKTHGCCVPAQRPTFWRLKNNSDFDSSLIKITKSSDYGYTNRFIDLTNLSLSCLNPRVNS